MAMTAMAPLPTEVGIVARELDADRRQAWVVGAADGNRRLDTLESVRSERE